ncbi:hypothetical protein MC7420_7859 [Coleofasciculus chthonoplastes PCC 7420]|uniref:Uncharacterized protein n=1 Tax=Coleofasciculus chthonoplastes PCC 7420 TaxID=118168 RepID=B4VIJ9_9CYAN|nr:hypothetical protein MC7420_7859 [Coleofasciculus chthonoplastes PCC 7420]
MILNALATVTLTFEKWSLLLYFQTWAKCLSSSALALIP